jgi:formaldehyde-activating enzyme involved in methanogenesis
VDEINILKGEIVKPLLILLTVLLVAACSDPSRNLYDGIKNNNDAKRSPSERAMTPTPSYDEYKKEREGKAKE